jgi:DNA-binding SARP family transcriptional activator
MQTGERADQLVAVRAGVHALASSLRQGDAKAPTILGMVVSAEALELLVDRPATPPPPWVSAAEGFRWRIQLSDIEECGWKDSDPLPALVPIGRAAGIDAEVLLNLEAAGIVSVTGNPAKATGVVRAVAAGLSGLPWAASVNVVVVGFGAELQAAEHVRAVADLNEIVAELESTAEVMRAVIGGPNPFEGRVREQAGDGWAPTVVLCPTTLAADQQGKLARLAEPGTGVVAIVVGRTVVGRTVVAGAAGNGWTIDVDTNPMAIQPLRLAVEPTILGDAEFDGIESLYQVAQDTSGATAEEPPYDELEVSVERTVSLPEAPPVFVRVLGTIELDGVGEFRRPKSRELAVFLALHPSGVGEAQLDEAMWPSNTGRVVAASTRDSTVSVARTALGGPRRLLPAQVNGREKRYQVSNDVGTDWAMFCDLHRRGRAERDVAVLLQALELVRGRPFDGVSSARTYAWVHTEGHARQMEAEIGDAADLAAELLLADGQAVEARSAARRGLLADPYLERLWVRLMEVADALGDSQEVERIMDELDKVLELNGDFSGLHPQTLVAYQRFSRRHRVRT